MAAVVAAGAALTWSGGRGGGPGDTAPTEPLRSLEVLDAEFVAAFSTALAPPPPDAAAGAPSSGAPGSRAPGSSASGAEPSPASGHPGAPPDRAPDGLAAAEPPPLAGLRWTADPTLPIEMASSPLGDWGVLELYRNADRALTGVYLVAQPADSDQFQDLVDISAAVVAAATGRTSSESRTLVERLGMAAGAGEMERAEPDGDRQITVRHAADAWHLRISAAR